MHDSFNVSSQRQTYISKIYGWMFIALLISAVSAAFSASVPFFSQSVGIGFGLIVVDFVLVLYLSSRITRMSFFASVCWFGLFSIAMGLSLGTIILHYTAHSIALAFLMTSLSFGVMSIYGFVTRRDLTTIGHFAFFGLIGIIITSFINFIFHSTMIYWIISYVGFIIFLILTAYDTQKIQRNSFYRDYPIAGSLTLYLDFINIFIYLLQIFGNEKS